MQYRPVFSASFRLVSGIESSWRSEQDIVPLISYAIAKHFSEETVVFVVATRHTATGLQWELYAFPYVSTLLSLRGRLGYRTKKEDGFKLVAYPVRKDFSGNSFISLCVPFAKYLWDHRRTQREYDKEVTPSALCALARPLLASRSR